jgi:phosphohistidine phosphatase SixA
MARGLLPDDPPEIVQAALTGEARDLVVVGHMPNIAALTQLLSQRPGSVPLHGLVVLERPSGEDDWAEVWRLAPE